MISTMRYRSLRCGQIRSSASMSKNRWNLLFAGSRHAFDQAVVNGVGDLLAQVGPDVAASVELDLGHVPKSFRPR